MQVFSQPGKMVFRWMGDVDMGQFEPLVDSGADLLGGHGMVQDGWVGGDADQTQQGNPSQADALRSRQGVVPPAAGPGVEGATRVVGEDQKIDVGQDHRGRESLSATASASS